MKKLGKDNKGFSLVEMIVAILITSFLMLGVSAFLQTSRVVYTEVSTGSRLQEEAGAATNFVNELLVEAIDCGTTTATVSGKDLNVLWITALENDVSGSATEAEIRKKSIYFIIFEKPGAGEETGYLRYKKVANYEVTDTDITFAPSITGEKVIQLPDDYFAAYVENPYVTISEYVTNMDASRLNSTNGRMFKVEFGFLFNGESYSASVNNYARNNSNFS